MTEYNPNESASDPLTRDDAPFTDPAGEVRPSPDTEAFFTPPTPVAGDEPPFVRVAEANPNAPYNPPRNDRPAGSFYMNGTFFVPVDPKTEQKKRERRELRRRAGTVSAALLFTLVASLIMGALFSTLLIFFHMDPKAVAELFQRPEFLYVMQTVFSAFCFTVPFAVGVRILGHRVSDLVPLKRSEAPLLPYLFIGLGCCAAGDFLTTFTSDFFDSIGFHYEVSNLERPEGLLGYFMTILVIAVLPALVEEFSMRGVAYGLFRKYGESFAIVASAALFGLMHGNFTQIPFAFLVGLGLGLLRAKTGSLVPGMILHFINNLVSSTLSALFDLLPIHLVNLLYTVYLAACLLLAFLGVLLLERRGEKPFALAKADPELLSARRERTKWFCTQPFVIIFAAVSLVESVIYFFI